MSVGPAEILVILIVALLVFGPERLPQVGRQVGAAVRELRKMQDAVRGELDMVLHPEHGTRPGDAPYEPGDHSTYTAYGDDEPVDVSSTEIQPRTFETGSVASDFTSPNGSAPHDDAADAESRFHGPPDSFI
jgi:sec-independent protein translocase protein TatA